MIRMSYQKDRAYREMPFSSETPHEDFYTCDTITNLHATCRNHRDKVMRVRTVGILGTENGGFYIEEIKTSHGLSTASDPQQCIQVCLAHMHRPPQSPSMPYPVKVFGRLEWRGCPVIFAQIIRVNEEYEDVVNV